MHLTRHMRWIYVSSLIVLLSLFCVFVWLRVPEQQAQDRQSPDDSFIAKKARAAYFHQMLLDPATGDIPPDIRKRELAYAAALRKYPPLSGKSGARSSSISWMEAGPNDVGGRTRALAVDRTNSNTVLAGGVAGGIWKSADRGASWELKSNPTELNSVTFITQDPREGHATTWYAVTGEFIGSNGDRGRRAPRYGEGLYTSTDNGESWTLVASAKNAAVLDSPFDIGLKVLVSPVSGSIFTASQAFGIQRLQGPTAEREWLLGMESLPEWSDIDIASDGTLLAVTSAGITPNPSEPPGVFYSTDDGTTWQDITPAGFPDAPERSVLAFAPSDPQVAYLWTFTGETVFSTSSFGEREIMQFYALSLPDGTSEDRSDNLPRFGGNLGDLYTQGNYDMVMAVNPADPNDVFIGGTNLYRSKNGFSAPLTNNDITKTWVGGYALRNNGDEYLRHHPDQHALFFDPQEEGVLWSGHDGGLSLATHIDSTTNLIDWIDKNNGYNVTQFYHVSITPEASDDRILGGTQDNGTPFLRFDPQAPSGSNSTRVTSGDGGYTYLGANYGISSTQRGEIFRLKYNVPSGLVSLADTDPITPPGASNQLFITPFAVDKTDESVIYYPGGNTLWRGTSVSFAPSWSQLDNATVPPGYNISALATGVRAANQLTTSVLYFAASGPGQPPIVYRLDEAPASRATPDQFFISDLPADAYIHHIAVNPLDGNELLVLASNYNITGLFHSTDGGESFTAVEGNLTGTEELPGPSLRAATILPVRGTVLYILATSTGVYSTGFLQGDNTEWTQEAVQTIGNTVVESITSRISDARIAAGTHGRGIFIGSPLPSVSVEPPDKPVAIPSSLAQNFPNPFRSETQLSYTLNQAARVNLRIYDATGRRVQTLLRQSTQPAGTHSFPFYSGTLPNGMYIYELEVHPLDTRHEVFREHKVMVLQK